MKVGFHKSWMPSASMLVMFPLCLFWMLVFFPFHKRITCQIALYVICARKWKSQAAIANCVFALAPSWPKFHLPITLVFTCIGQLITSAYIKSNQNWADNLTRRWIQMIKKEIEHAAGVCHFCEQARSQSNNDDSQMKWIF